MEIPKHLSPEERQSILMKNIGYVSDEVYKGITDMLLRYKIEKKRGG
jgi:hypothetical protein